MPKWTFCVGERVASIDDSRSDARSVAAAVWDLCRQTWMDEMSEDMPAHARAHPETAKVLNGYADQERTHSLDTISGLVLRARRPR